MAEFKSGDLLWYLSVQRGGDVLVTKTKARHCGYTDKRGRHAIEVEQCDGRYARRFVNATSIRAREEGSDAR